MFEFFIGKCREFDWSTVFARDLGYGFGLIAPADQRDFLQVAQYGGMIVKFQDVFYFTVVLDDFVYLGIQSQVVSILRKYANAGGSYADVGCGDGFVTIQAARAVRCAHCVGYDFNPEVLDLGRMLYPEIDFRRWNPSNEPPPDEKYSVVTCLETLEHVPDLRSTLRSLLSITEHLLLLTVPVEVGPIGLAKFAAKVVMGRETLTAEHEGSKLDYFRTLLRGDSVSRFRVHPEDGHWKLHTGFDHREIHGILEALAVRFRTFTRGWNKFYLVHARQS